MCGRFALTADPAGLQEAFPGYTFPLQGVRRFNIAPTQPILVLPNNGTNQTDFFVWGLIPSWAKDAAIGSRLINARAETLAEKPSFRAALKYRRCLIFADGFYEWQAQGGTKVKVPYFIRLKSGKPFAFAGLWECWQSPDGSEIKSAAIITTTANALVAAIHDRMPVILPAQWYVRWLEPSLCSLTELQACLLPYPAEEMAAYPVSGLVNSPANDGPDLIQPV